ncbi:YegP family protein [Salinimicrobium sp. HB62]|uniref:YegP family protein n=1 Tax=Salinimicrobium sp. HB62 TaxID=3077781 RepID=UPI002D77871D|nr:YegP family protein [Salinimicrobium sp. HB62]
MAKFEIKKDKSGQFIFNLKARNGQIILSSEAYKTKASCLNGIASVQKNSQVNERFEIKEVPSGHRFNLKSTNGQVVGSSETYSSKAALEKGIASVKKNSPDATIDDLSD